MANEDLVIEIGANTKNLTSELTKAQNNLKGFAAEAARSSAALGGSMVKGVSQAGFALQNFSRVAQDAPFGLIGIQNNIQPLLESFVALKKETGSTGAALKALGASLAGSGGLLLGVSLVTSAMTVLAQNPEKVAGALNYLSGVVESATGSQLAFNKALEENQASAQVEIVALTNLIAIAGDETLSRNARTEALKKSKAEYPEQLNFLTLENVKSKEAAAAIDLLSQSLLRKAKIQAAEKLIGDAFVKQLQAQTKSVTEQASTMAKVTGAILNSIGIKNIIVLKDGFDNQKEAIKSTSDEIKIYTNLLKKLNTEEAIAGTLFDDPIKKEKVKKKPNFRDEQFDGRAMQDVSGRVQVGLDGLLEQYRLTEWEIGRVELVPPPDRVKAGLGYINAELVAFNSRASEIVNGSIVNTFAGIGEAIGESLANGTSLAASLGSSLLSSLGSVLGQLGQMAIATGLAILGIKTALKTLNPFAAIAAGVGLLALSGVVKGAASRLGGSMGSGSGGGGDFGSSVPTASSVQAGSSVNNFNGGRVVFEIAGQKLVGVLANTLGANNRIVAP